MTAISFKIGAVNGGGSRVSTFINGWMKPKIVNPPADTVVFDVNCGPSGAIGMLFQGTGKLLVKGTILGTDFAFDLTNGISPVFNQWNWFSIGCGSYDEPTNHSHVILGGALWNQHSALIGSNQPAGGTLGDIHTTNQDYPSTVGWGVSQGIAGDGNPNDGSVMFLSKVEFYEKASLNNMGDLTSVVGPPSADRSGDPAVQIFYSCRQTLGAATTLTDSGAAFTDLHDGPQGGTIVLDGPYTV